MTTDIGLPQMRFRRDNVIDTAPEYDVLRANAPLTRVRTPAGDPAWLTTGYHVTKQLLAETRLGRSHPDPENAPRISDSMRFGGPQGDHATEADLHKLHRRLLAPAFSPRRMNLIADHISDLTDQALNDLADLEPPVDLHDRLSFPLPIRVVCELLGVPLADRDRIRDWSWEFASLSDHDGAMAAGREMFAYMAELVARKRVEPADDLMSDLVAASAEHDLLTDMELADMGMNLLFGGHETTVARIDYGTLLLLTHPDQLKALRDDPALVEPAVEEIMRFSVPVDDTFPRYAHADIEVGDVTIRAGEAVLLPPSVANRDPEVFPDPHRFDIRRRSAQPHLGFGHGPHYCVGSGLARLELKAVFGRLFQRFAGLELAVPAAELELNEDRFTGGLRRLPVTW
ncbi:pentalenolactone synthase [Nocardiopsis sp. Huas11]|uniref:cytochrome P450 n=1 Tax=Nocardiopsis sp. Huas11 TaxID=2183912 RepID=UPI000EAC1131|nr:cytochrome P450 [Nocardiopsis sp. Huas11]RKS10366.1 pentalenolactone synthase [Nocardiopsis sp. Huas11]